MTLSIVIATYNRAQDVQLLLEQLFGQQSVLPFEIIIVDQEKTSGLSVDKKNRYFLIHQDKANLPKARNKGWKAATGEIVLFLDDDVEIPFQSIEAHVNAYRKNISGVSGRVINSGEKIPQERAVETGRASFWLTDFLWQYWSQKTQIVQFPYGCNMSFRRKVLQEIGGFDEKFLPPVSAFEEVDFGLRVTNRGHKILFVPEAEVFHKKSPAGGTRLPLEQKTHSFWYAYGRFAGKHADWKLPITLSWLITRVLKEDWTSLPWFLSGWKSAILQP